MDDKLNTIERKELPDSVLAYLKEENIQCRMPPMLELPRRISDIVPDDLKPKLARAILARAKEYGVDVESPTVLSYAEE